MNEQEIRKIETADYDIIENVIVALRELWKKKLLIVLVTIAGFLISIIVTSMIGNATRYYSSATLFSAVYGSNNDSTTGVATMNKYADLIGSSRVCSRAAQALTEYNLTTSDLQKMVNGGYIKISGASSKSASYGNKLIVAVTADSPEIVLPLTNAMASAFASECNELIGTEMIQVMDDATKYAYYDTLNVKMYMLLFTGGAFAGICGLIFVLAFFSPWVRSVAQCEQDPDLILGLIPYVRNK